MFQSHLENSYVEIFDGKEYPCLHQHFVGYRARVYPYSYHRSIDRAPASVSLLNVDQVRRKLYGESWTKPRRELKFKLGHQVRISKARRTFKKGYLRSWTQEIFTVTKIIPRVPPVHRLRDYADDEIEVVFYVHKYTSTQVHKYTSTQV